MSEDIHFPRAMGEADALIWRVERDPVLRSTAAAVTILDRAPQRDLLSEKLRRAACAIPRLRQRVIELPAVISTPVWAQHPHFDLDYHLRWVRAPGDRSLRAVLDLAGSVAMQGFDPTRPLWEFVVVEDLADGRAALLQKLHHAVTDGVGGLLLMRRVYDRQRETRLADEAPAEASERADGSTLRLAVAAVAKNLLRRPGIVRRRAARLLESAAHPFQMARTTLADLASIAHVLAPALRPLSPIMHRRSTSYRFETLSVPLHELKAAAHAAECRLNDAFLAAVTAGWRLYHENHDAAAESLRMALPINLRSNEGSSVAGNSLMFARFAVPVNLRDPRERMQRIRALVADERAQPALRHAETIARLLNLMPSAVLAKVFGTMVRSVDFIASCVPGLPVALYLAGARVESMFTFGPPLGAAANVTLFSYLEQAEIAINADPASIPDHRLLKECMQEGFDEVRKVA